MAKFVHTMVRVTEEDRSVDFYHKAFGLDVAARLDFDDFTLVYLSNDENTVELELTINKGQEGAYEMGNGYGHIAFVVDDLNAEHARLEELGLEPRKLVDFIHNGETLARFFFVTDPDGYSIEIIERNGRYQ